MYSKKLRHAAAQLTALVKQAANKPEFWHHKHRGMWFWYSGEDAKNGSAIGLMVEMTDTGKPRAPKNSTVDKGWRPNPRNVTYYDNDKRDHNEWVVAEPPANVVAQFKKHPKYHE